MTAEYATFEPLGYLSESVITVVTIEADLRLKPRSTVKSSVLLFTGLAIAQWRSSYLRSNSRSLLGSCMGPLGRKSSLSQLMLNSRFDLTPFVPRCTEYIYQH